MDNHDLQIKSFETAIILLKTVDKVINDSSIQEAELMFDVSERCNLNLNVTVRTEEDIITNEIEVNFSKEYDYILYKRFLDFIILNYVYDDENVISPLEVRMREINSYDFNKQYDLSIVDVGNAKTISIILKSFSNYNKFEEVINSYNDRLKNEIISLKKKYVKFVVN